MINGKKIVALCCPTISEAQCHKYIISLNKYISSDDCRLLVFTATTDLYINSPTQHGEAAIFDLINYDTTDAVIIVEERIKAAYVIEGILEKAKAHNIPCLVIGQQHDGTANAEFNYEKGFRLMVEHVLDVHGVKRPHFMAGMKGNDFSESRKRVFAEICESRGIGVDDTMISYGDFWSDPAQKATEELLKRTELPEAIICANDAMAIAVTNTLTENGVRVPDDVIVTGFDGIEDIKYSVPRITSCMCSYEKMAKKTAAIVKSMLDGEPVPDTSLITPSLILSESCGCSKDAALNAADTISDISNRFYRFRSEERQMYEMSSRILTCKTVDEAACLLNSYDLYDMNCVLKNECIDPSVDPVSGGTAGYGDTVIEFFETDCHRKGRHETFRTADYLPDFDEMLNSHDTPIIFCGLNVLDIPLGYCCFHFHNCDLVNYVKSEQTVSALNNAISGFRNMRYHRYLMDQIEEMYRLDALTSLYNRSGFIREYRRRTTAGAPGADKMTVIMTDLDGLKKINDNYGHDEGDFAIKTAAEAMRCCCPEDTLCVRFGGDEMLAVYFGTLDEKKLKADFEKFYEERNAASGKPYKISASVGMYECNIMEEINFDELVKRSDKLMYFDKARKKLLRNN
ncbi:MAG: diguanylate cyclase [Oscillospiraceae bacterium]